MQSSKKVQKKNASSKKLQRKEQEERELYRAYYASLSEEEKEETRLWAELAAETAARLWPKWED
jgi:hypothetical protein